MTDFKRVYRSQAHEYQRLVSHEDHEGNIERKLEGLLDLEEARVVELGAGTGRLTQLLCRRVASVLAADRAKAMLGLAAELLSAGGCDNWQLLLADNRHLPLAGGWADLVVAGWAIGHSIEWHPHTWQGIVEGTVGAMRRLLRPGGSILILETLGTGQSEPSPPSPGLAAYYQLLENGLGFEASWARTDYRFEDPEQGAEVVRFFFGEELAERILQEQLTIVPECTGFWLWRDPATESAERD